MNVITHQCDFVILDKNLIFCEMLKEALQNREYSAVFCYPFSIVNINRYVSTNQSICIIGPHFSSEEQIQVIDTIRYKTSKAIVLMARSKDVVVCMQKIQMKLSGLLCDTVSMSELFFCLQELKASRNYTSPKLVELPYSPASQFQANEVQEKTTLLKTLTKREKEILYKVSLAHSTNQIAETLFISPVTVNNHKANIREKLKIKGENRLLYYALMLKSVLNQSTNTLAL